MIFALSLLGLILSILVLFYVFHYLNKVSEHRKAELCLRRGFLMRRSFGICCYDTLDYFVGTCVGADENTITLEMADGSGTKIITIENIRNLRAVDPVDSYRSAIWPTPSRLF
jgi:hypothetical protein